MQNTSRNFVGREDWLSKEPTKRMQVNGRVLPSIYKGGLASIPITYLGCLRLNSSWLKVETEAEWIFAMGVHDLWGRKEALALYSWPRVWVPVSDHLGWPLGVEVIKGVGIVSTGRKAQTQFIVSQALFSHLLRGARQRQPEANRHGSHFLSFSPSDGKRVSGVTDSSVPFRGVPGRWLYWPLYPTDLPKLGKEYGLCRQQVWNQDRAFPPHALPWHQSLWSI